MTGGEMRKYIEEEEEKQKAIIQGYATDSNSEARRNEFQREQQGFFNAPIRLFADRFDGDEEDKYYLVIESMRIEIDSAKFFTLKNRYKIHYQLSVSLDLIFKGLTRTYYNTRENALKNAENPHAKEAFRYGLKPILDY